MTDADYRARVPGVESSRVVSTDGLNRAEAGTERGRPVWPWPALATSIYLLQIVPRLRIDGPLWFAHFGRLFLHSSSTSSVISPSLGATSRMGYDGQFYFAAAADPGHAPDYIRHFVSPGFVYSRALYPALARVLGFGSVQGIAYALVLVNLAAMFVGTLAVASWLRRRGVSTAYALLYGLYPGLVFSVFRDLTEPLAFALAALAVWTFDRKTRRAVAIAGVLMACSLLTRETTAPFAVGLAVALVTADWYVRRGFSRFTRGLSFLASVTAPLLAWRLVVHLWLGAGTQESPGGVTYLIPFHAYATQWPWTSLQTLVVVAVAVPALLTAAVLVPASRNRLDEGWPLAVFFLSAIAFVAYLPAPVFVDYGAAGRAALGVVLAFLYCLPALKARPSRARIAALVWSPLWYVAAGSVLGLPAIRLLIT